MANSTTAIQRAVKSELGKNTFVGLIKTSEVLVVGGLVNFDVSAGVVVNASDTAGDYPIGVVVGASDGDNSATGLTGDGTKTVICQCGHILENVSITGATAATDTFDKVYATDNQTLTLSANSNNGPHGIVHRWRTSTYCDVLLYDLLSQAI
jgi:hypothetical protein